MIRARGRQSVALVATRGPEMSASFRRSCCPGSCRLGACGPRSLCTADLVGRVLPTELAVASLRSSGPEGRSRAWDPEGAGPVVAWGDLQRGLNRRVEVDVAAFYKPRPANAAAPLEQSDFAPPTPGKMAVTVLQKQTSLIAHDFREQAFSMAKQAVNCPVALRA